ncbi:MAG: D-amino acid aminotransferase [Methylococcaceae bacterium]|nr:D-amino acid aminotransferase [Methylococcaceae bacterium]
MQNKSVYLNGAYVPLNEAKISVLDRGFLFGDGIYEVIPVYNGQLFHFQQHMERMELSLAGIRLANPHDRVQWLNIIMPFLDSGQDQSVYVQITRGAAEKRDHAFPKNIAPTVFVMCSEVLPYEGKYTGIRAISVDDSRWGLCNIKAITLLANILLRQTAIDQGCAEAILVKDGYVTEGAASNVFAVIDGIVVTPPKGNDILPGITRDVIVKIAQEHGIPCTEEVISLDALAIASEIWITSSMRELVPVVELDYRPIADGKPGPVFQMLDQLFQNYKQSLV